jgi:hypothetical protein
MFQVELENGSIEWDGNVATREHCFVSTWDRGIVLAPGDDVLKITQCADADEAAEGINRNGVHYKFSSKRNLFTSAVARWLFRCEEICRSKYR